MRDREKEERGRDNGSFRNLVRIPRITLSLDLATKRTPTIHPNTTITHQNLICLTTRHKHTTNLLPTRNGVLLFHKILIHIHEPTKTLPDQAFGQVKHSRVKGCRKKKTFTMLGDSYTSLFHKLKQLDMLRSIQSKLPNPPPKNLDYNVSCEYCSGTLGHHTEKCWNLKSVIQELIDTNGIEFLLWHPILTGIQYQPTRSQI